MSTTFENANVSFEYDFDKLKYKLTAHEKQSKKTRVDWAEGLISQLPSNHDGRNSWLLNYGVKEEACLMRSIKGLTFSNKTKSIKNINQL